MNDDTSTQKIYDLNAGLVNSSAEDDAWFVKIEISDSGEVSSLMNEAEYKEHCEKEAH